MIEVRLFGDLRCYAAGSTSGPGTVVYLPADEGETLGRVLVRMGIEPEKVSNVFINGRLLPRSAYPITLGYPLAAERPLASEGYLDASVKSGDRLGIFPRNMGMVVV